jgi:hypothetical protein
MPSSDGPTTVFAFDFSGDSISTSNLILFRPFLPVRMRLLVMGLFSTNSDGRGKLSGVGRFIALASSRLDLLLAVEPFVSSCSLLLNGPRLDVRRRLGCKETLSEVVASARPMRDDRLRSGVTGMIGVFISSRPTTDLEDISCRSSM